MQISSISSSGFRYSQKENREKKQKARDLVTERITLARYPNTIRVISLPGLSWEWEKQVLSIREKNWITTGIKKTDFFCFESNPDIFELSKSYCPDINQVSFFDQDVGQSKSMLCNAYIDLAWFDYSGSLNLFKFENLVEWWKDGNTKTIAITACVRSSDIKINKLIDEYLGRSNLFSIFFPGINQKYIEYTDPNPKTNKGAKMFQYIVDRG